MFRHLLLLTLLLVLIISLNPAAAFPESGGPGGECIPTAQQHGCSVFVAANDLVALAGNNEDWRNPFTKLWFIPAGEGTFGQMYVGFDNYYPQGGMNDQGLFFDGLAVETTIVPRQTDLPDVPDNALSILMSTCADVSCVVEYLDNHDRPQLTNAQIFFGDAKGDAVIIEPTEMIRKSGAFLVSTNFYQSTTPPAEITCERFQTAQLMLSEADGDFNVELFRQILDATHQEGDFPTQYSNIYDMQAKVMYLYLFHDFEHVVEVHLAEELARGVHEYDIASLFPESFEQAAFRDVRWRDYLAFLKRQGYDPDLDTSGFEAYVGRYAIPTSPIESGAAAAGSIEISMQDGLLHYDLTGDIAMRMPLYATSPTTFVASSFDANVILFDLEFLLVADGQVSGIRGNFGGETPILFERMS